MGWGVSLGDVIEALPQVEEYTGSASTLSWTRAEVRGSVWNGRATPPKRVVEIQSRGIITIFS